jgi:hypothetical protein
MQQIIFCFGELRNVQGAALICNSSMRINEVHKFRALTTKEFWDDKRNVDAMMREASGEPLARGAKSPTNVRRELPTQHQDAHGPVPQIDVRLT